ncbi:hypothetical protein [Kitasatospora sp. NPDC004289]
MSSSIFLLRFEGGEPADLDSERFLRLTQPYVVDGGPGEGFSRIRTEDGGEADLYHRDGRGGVTITHFTRGEVLGVIARLAVALGAVIVPQDGPTVFFREEDRAQLPVALRDDAVVTEPTAGALLAALEGR